MTDDLPGLSVSRETQDCLEVFARELQIWNRKINLVAPSSIPELWTRHIADSLQLTEYSRNEGAWIDLGSGAGLPGLITAAFYAEKSPCRQFTLVESDKRKAAFIREAARKMDLNVAVKAKRIEELAVESSFSTISARALAPLTKLLDYSKRLSDSSTELLFLKGENAEAEIIEAEQRWRMRLDRIQSRTSRDSVVLRITEFSRVDD